MVFKKRLENVRILSLLTYFRKSNKFASGSQNNREVVVVAHRGGRFDSPNTLIAIKKAINYSQLHQEVPFMIEVDVQQSKPDQGEVYGGLVVIHDSTINRTTTSQGRVSSYTLEQLGNMTMRSPKKQINQNILGNTSTDALFMLRIENSDRRIPSLQEVLDVLDVVNEQRMSEGVDFIGLGIDFTHVKGRMARFKDHFLHPLMEKINPGSQIHKVSTPEPLLKQLAYEISIRQGITPIQVISQGVHGSRHLGILMNLLEESSITFSIALQASTSYFPADIRSVKTSFGLYENDIHQLLVNNKFTINYNHRWDRLTHRLRRFTGFNIVNPFSLLPSRIAITNQQAMLVANAEGFKTGFWTVNSKAAIRDVIKWGADMVTTDYPPRVVEVLEELYGKCPDSIINTVEVIKDSGVRLGESGPDVSMEKVRDGVLS